MSSDRKSSREKDAKNTRPDTPDFHTGGGADGPPHPHLEKAKSKNRIEPISVSTGSGANVRPEKAAAVAGDKTQTAGVSAPSAEPRKKK
jgi:hypothetical protein